MMVWKLSDSLDGTGSLKKNYFRQKLNLGQHWKTLYEIGDKIQDVAIESFIKILKKI